MASTQIETGRIFMFLCHQKARFLKAAR